jgi:hypothetical protein
MRKVLTNLLLMTHLFAAVLGKSAIALFVGIFVWQIPLE